MNLRHSRSQNRGRRPFYQLVIRNIGGLAHLCYVPSMLTINLSRFQASTVFFLSHSHLIYTFILFFCSASYFYLACFVYFIIFRSIFIRRILYIDRRNLSLSYFFNFFSQRAFLSSVYFACCKACHFIEKGSNVYFPPSKAYYSSGTESNIYFPFTLTCTRQEWSPRYISPRSRVEFL